MVKNSLKTPQGQKLSMFQQRQDPKTNNDLQNIHIKLKIKQHDPYNKPGVNSCDPQG